MPSDYVTATIDGAARGNPGPAAYGAVFEDAKGAVKARLSSKIGKATNNVAEYRALLAALNYAREQGWQALKVRTDSELLARQLQGRYKVKSADLKPLHAEAQQLISSLDYFSVESVPRKLTRAADKLANAALDGRPAIRVSRPAKTAPSPEAPASGKSRTIRALYRDGVLKPFDPLDLPDGAEVELSLRPRKN
ncbi:MAG: reverse transcriptase-like protein [Candidatus Acidiferrales bacterium]